MKPRTNGHSGTTGRRVPFLVQGGSDERRADPLALVAFVDLGVDEDRPAAVAHIASESDDVVALSCLEARLRLVVLDGHLWSRCRPSRHPSDPAPESSR